MGVVNWGLGKASERGSTLASALKTDRIGRKLTRARARGNANRIAKYEGTLGKYQGLLNSQLNRNFESNVKNAIREYEWRPLGDKNASNKVNRLLRNARTQGRIPKNIINKMENKYEAAKSKKIANRNGGYKSYGSGANYGTAAGTMFSLM